jgi:hypothetical protein
MMPNPLKDWRTILTIVGSILMVISLFMSWGPMIALSQSLPDDEEFVNTYFVDEAGQVGVISRPGDDPENPVLRSNIPGRILAHATKNAMVILVPIVAVISLALVIFTASSGLIYLHAGLAAIWAAICVVVLAILPLGPFRYELTRAFPGLGFWAYAAGTVLMATGCFVLQFLGKEERKRIRVEMAMAGERDKIVHSTQTIRTKPTDPRPYLTRGYAYKRRERIAEAIADLEKYLELSSEERSKEIVRKTVDELKAQIK